MLLDIKRVWSKRIPFLILCLSLMMVVFVNTIWLESYNEDPSISDLTEYGQLVGELYNQIDRSQLLDNTMTDGQALMDSLPEEKYRDEDYNTIGYWKELNLDYFSTLKRAFELDNIQLDDTKQAHLDYALQASGYMEEHQLYSTRPFAYSTFFDGINIYFHPIVGLLVVLIMLGVIGEEYEMGTYKFNRILPKSNKQLIFEKYILILLLSFLYVFLTLVLYGLYAWYNDYQFNDISFPVRISESVLGAPLIKIIVKSIIVFLSRVLVFFSIGLLLVTLLKRIAPSVIIMSVLFFILSKATDQFSFLQANWNPLHADYRLQLASLTTYIVYPDDMSATLTTVATPFNRLILIGWLGFVVILGLFTERLVMNDWNIVPSSINLDCFLNTFNRLPFGFELKKLIAWLKPNLVYSSFLIILFYFIFILFQQDASVYQSVIYHNENPEIVGHEDFLTSRKVELELLRSLELDPVKRTSYALSIEDLEDQLDALEFEKENYRQIKSSYENNQSQEFYENIVYLTDVAYGQFTFEDFNNFKPKQNYYINGSFPTDFGYKVSKHRLNLLSEHGITPILNTQRTLVPYDYPKRKSDFQTERLSTQPSDQSFLGILYRLIDGFRIDLIVLIFILVTCSANYYLDWSMSRSDKWLALLPVQPTVIFRNKIRASYFRMVCFILFFVLVIFLVGIVNDGIGYANFPVFILKTSLNIDQLSNDYQQYYGWMDLGIYVLKILGGMIVAGAFILNIATVVSLMSRTFLKTVATTLMILLGGYWLSLIPALDKIMKWLPFRYLNLSDNITGFIYFEHDISHVPVFMGYMILVLWSVLIYLIGYILISKNQRKGEV